MTNIKTEIRTHTVVDVYHHIITDEGVARRWLILMSKLQTYGERMVGSPMYHNGVGFRGRVGDYERVQAILEVPVGQWNTAAWEEVKRLAWTYRRQAVAIANYFTEERLLAIIRNEAEFTSEEMGCISAFKIQARHMGSKAPQAKTWDGTRAAKVKEAAKPVLKSFFDKLVEAQQEHLDAAHAYAVREGGNSSEKKQKYGTLYYKVLHSLALAANGYKPRYFASQDELEHAANSVGLG
jgi:hypothetical protein